MRVVLADYDLVNGYTLGLAAGLRQHGVDILVAGPAQGGDPDGIPIYRRGVAPGDRLSKVVEATMGVARLRRILKEGPDLLHLQWSSTLNVAYALAATRLYGVPLAYTVHNFQRSTDPMRQDVLQGQLIALADLVLTHGPAQREALVNEHPLAASKTHASEHGNYEHVIVRYSRGEARARLGLPLSGPVYALVGGLAPRKGVELLIEAIHRRQLRGQPGHLVIAGPSTVSGYATRIHEAAKRLGPCVHWLVSSPPVAQETLDLAISAANQVVLPFRDTSQSGSVIMAMTHGRCVVATAAGELPRTLRGRGIVVPSGELAALLEALNVAEVDPDRCDRLGRDARRYALSTLSWSRIGELTASLYAKVLEARRVAAVGV